MNDFLKYTFAGEKGLFLVSRSLFRVFSRRFLRFLLGLGSGLLYLFSVTSAESFTRSMALLTVTSLMTSFSGSTPLTLETSMP